MSPRVALALALALTFARTVAAHELGEGTSRVTLRDNHLEVLAEWDVFPLADADPTALATGPDAAVIAARARLVARIERDTRLRVDGETVDLAVTAGPSPQELRALAATVSASGEGHGGRARLRLEARRAVPDARRVSLSPPPEVGPVLVSFVQPAARYTRPGDTATFEVLAPRAAVPATAAPRPPPDPRSPPWPAALVTLLAFAALAAWRWPTSPSPRWSTRP